MRMAARGGRGAARRPVHEFEAMVHEIDSVGHLAFSRRTHLIGDDGNVSVLVVTNPLHDE